MITCSFRHLWLEVARHVNDQIDRLSKQRAGNPLLRPHRETQQRTAGPPSVQSEFRPPKRRAIAAKKPSTTTGRRFRDKRYHRRHPLRSEGSSQSLKLYTGSASKPAATPTS